MTLVPFNTLDGPVWINPLAVTHVRAAVTDAQPTDQARTVVYITNSKQNCVFVMSKPADVVQKLIEWSRGGDI